MENEKLITTKSPGTDPGLSYYFKELSCHGLCSMEDEVHLSQRIQAGDCNARDQLVNSNLRFVVKIAKQYLNSGMQFQDLIQEGNIGLLTAAEKFDWAHGVRFSTYASWWIKQAITRAILNKQSMVRLPYRKEERVKQIKRSIVENSLNSNAKSAQAIAESLHMQRAEVVELLGFCAAPASLDHDQGDDTGCMYDVYADNTFAPETMVMQKQVIDQINAIVCQLETKERLVLSHRYELEGNEKLTLKSIAIKLHTSPETVRQIELRALRKIKSLNPDLKDYISSVA